MAIYIGSTKSSLVSRIRVPEIKMGIGISGIIGNVDDNGILQLPTDGVHFKLEDSVLGVADSTFYYMFNTSAGLLDVDLNNLKTVGKDSFNTFARSTSNCSYATGFNNIETINNSGMYYMFYGSDLSENTNGIDFSSLKTVESNSLYYAFYNTKITGTVYFGALENIKSGAFNYAFAGTKIDKVVIDVPKLWKDANNSYNNGGNFTYTFSNCSDLTEFDCKFKQIYAYLGTTSSSISDSYAVFGHTFYSSPNVWIKFDELEGVMGWNVFANMTSNLSTDAMNKFKFKKLEYVYGNNVFHQMCNSSLPSGKGFMMFPSLVQVRQHKGTSGGTSDNYKTLAKCLNTSAKINGPVIFPSINFQTHEFCVMYTSNTVWRVYSPMFLTTGASDNKGVTEIHFPATYCRSYGDGQECRWMGSNGMSFTKGSPSSTFTSIPVYDDIVESIVVNNKRYYRDETISEYNNNNDKTHTAWRRCIITVDEVVEGEPETNTYIFYPRGLYMKSDSSNPPPVVYYGWQKGEGGLSSCYQYGNGYTENRMPEVGDNFYRWENWSLVTTNPGTITNVTDEVVYTTYNINTHAEPVPAHMYAWSNGTDTFYSQYDNITDMIADNPSISMGSQQTKIYSISSFGYAAYSLPAGVVKFNNSVQKVNSVDEANNTFNSYGMRSSSVSTFSRTPASDRTHTPTPVYSDLGITQIGAVEFINNI